MGHYTQTKNERTDGTQAGDPVGDGELIALVRKGDQGAFETLFRRHHAAASYVARTQSDNFSDAEDVVAEAFSSIFQSLAAGKGPDAFFRAYLLTIVRRIAYARNRAASRVQTTGDDAVLDTHTFDEDPAIKEFEAMAMAQAFKSLPERWQAVLWHVDVEKMKPAAAAEIIGISPNGVSSLAIRAREGLHRAYLQNHVLASTGTDCEAISAQLGAFARGGLKRSSNQRIQDHLVACAKCTGVLAELDDVQSRMRIVLFPQMTGIAFTPGANALLTSATMEPALRHIRRIEVRKIFGSMSSCSGWQPLLH
jgi:RNA polymerase sigma factor (sigma-70 family)